jgi:hypothetical protein
LGNRTFAASIEQQSALAGTYFEERPVHPEGFVEETLTLNEDGTPSHTISDPASKENQAIDITAGTWTVELAGARTRLRPKTGEDDALIPLDAYGNSTDAMSVGLHRIKTRNR